LERGYLGNVGLKLTPEALHAPGIARACSQTDDDLVSGIISSLGISRVVAVSPESVLAIRAAKQAVPALAVEGITALQACNAWGNLLANQVSEQAWFVPAQPHCKPFA
jgi:hypothetical protein